jgi:hypothetical protein
MRREAPYLQKPNPFAMTMDWIELVAGAWLVISVWVLSFTAATGAAWTSWLTGVAISIVALWAMAVRPRRSALTAEWANLILGVWLFVSPWIVSFTNSTSASWNAWVTGVVVALASILAMIPRTAARVDATGARDAGGQRWAA